VDSRLRGERRREPATAEAMQGPPERHLVKRQQYFLYIIEDILYHAYQRAAQLGFYPPLTSTDYAGLFTPEIPDVSLRDNTLLAQAANDIANAMSALDQSQRRRPTLPNCRGWCSGLPGEEALAPPNVMAQVSASEVGAAWYNPDKPREIIEYSLAVRRWYDGKRSRSTAPRSRRCGRRSWRRIGYGDAALTLAKPSPA
jgi:hypothetical protein